MRIRPEPEEGWALPATSNLTGILPWGAFACLPTNPT